MRFFSSLALAFFLTFPALSVPRPSISDSRPLMDILAVMADVAAEGPAMSYFGWSEEPRAVARDARCEVASREDAAAYLTDLITQMDWITPDQAAVIDANLSRAVEDLGRVLERDDLRRCVWGFSEDMSYTKYVHFENRLSGYQVTFTEGYED